MEEGSEETPHSPVFSRRRKNTTRPKKPAKTNAIGSEGLSNLFAPSSAASDSKLDQAHSEKSTSYAIKNHGESMELDALPSTAGDAEAGRADGEDIEMESGSSDHDEQPDHLEGAIEEHGETPAEDHSDDLPAAKVPRDYSNEARTYIVRYEDLSILHDLGRHNECREGCLDLLTEPRLPLWTRIQTLQMVATLLPPAPAEDCLNKAADVIAMMDPSSSMWQTRLLKGDNDRMFADLNRWRNKKGLVGKDLDGMEYGDIGGQPAAEYFKFDRHKDYLAADEHEKADAAAATVNAGPSTPLVVRTKEDEQLPSPTDDQLPSPTSSPTEE